MDPLYRRAEIRPATADDLDAVRAIRNDAICRSTAIWTGVQQSRSEASAWLGEHLRRGSIVVAELHGEVVGFGCWGPWRTKEGYRHTVGDSVYIAQGHHGRGIGRALLESVIDSARAAGAHVIVADIEAGNEASLRLHQRLGFETVGTLREVGTKFDRWLDLTIMQRPLHEAAEEAAGASGASGGADA